MDVIAEHHRTLSGYLHEGRDALRWKLDGLGELDARRPLTPTGLSLLGLTQHVAVCAVEYFGVTFGRPFAEATPDVDADPHADFLVPAEQSTEQVLGWIDRTWAHADATIEALPLDAPGRVPWWRPESADVTLQRILVHMIAETHRHAGHADILREQIDGSAGLRPAAPNLSDAMSWPEHVDRVQRMAEEATRRHGTP